MRGLVGAAALCALITLCTAAAAATTSAPIVSTASGKVQGQSFGAYNRFLGIPYARPPLGSLRWKRPQPAQAWPGIKQTMAFANSCIQAGTFSFAQSEDCLYLNIWAPANATKAPVMFWIHGGGWEYGTPLYFDGSNLTSLYDVIIVTAAYRLGPLGFLAESHLLASEPYLGSLGTLDQQLAMQWVQQNIAAFGGDPKRVTIFGQSAGGGSVGIHITLPSSKGLYRNAISESGLWFFPTIADSLPQGAALTAALGCANVTNVTTCLLAAPAMDVMHALKANGDITIGFRNTSDGVHWFPIIDGEYFTGQPLVLALKGAVHANAVLIGTNAQEGSVFVYPQFNYQQLTKAQYESWVATSFDPSFVAPSYTTYSNDTGSGDYLAALSDMTGDFWFQCQRLLFAQATAAASIPTYTYLFSYPYTSPGQPDIGATHHDELAFVWDGGEPFNASEAQLALWMSSAWAAFARADDPNEAGLPVEWPPHSGSGEHPINFNLALSMLPAAYRSACCPMWLPTLLAGEWPTTASV